MDGQPNDSGPEKFARWLDEQVKSVDGQQQRAHQRLMDIAGSVREGVPVDTRESRETYVECFTALQVYRNVRAQFYERCPELKPVEKKPDC